MEHVHPLDRPGVRSLIAKKLSISRQSLSNWKASGDVPIRHCVDIERATNGAVTRKDLRPDDWQAIWPELITPKRKAAKVA